MATYVYCLQGSAPFTAASGPSAPYAPIFKAAPDDVSASIDVNAAIFDGLGTWEFHTPSSENPPQWNLQGIADGTQFPLQIGGKVLDGLPQIYVISDMLSPVGYPGGGISRMFTDIGEAYACAAAQSLRTVMVVIAPDGASKWLNAEPFAATYQGTQVAFPIGTTKSLATVTTENAPAPDPSQWKELFIGQTRALYGHNIESFKLHAQLVFTETYRASYPEPAQALAPGFGPSPNADPASPL